MAEVSQQMFLGSAPITLIQNNRLVVANPFQEGAPEPTLVSVEYLVVGGGGGGGGNVGGGGGAGGLLSGSFMSALQAYTIKVGLGGTAGYGNGTAATSGATSSIDQTYVALGGGRGSGYLVDALNGGSGGGGCYPGTAPGTGSYGPPIQGYPGGTANFLTSGGGGGASATGSNATGTINVGSQGGDGKQSAISGVLTYYAGGGGGCRSTYGTSQAATGGQGGGGNGGYNSEVANTPLGNATAGTANTGGGGGGGSWGDLMYGADGGSGVVILRYSGAAKATGGTITTDGGFTVHTFTTSGTFNYTG